MSVDEGYKYVSNKKSFSSLFLIMVAKKRRQEFFKDNKGIRNLSIQPNEIIMWREKYKIIRIKNNQYIERNSKAVP